MIELFKNRSVEPSQVNDYLVSRGTNIIAQKVKFEALLLRPQIQMDSILNETLIFSDILSENKISREIIKQAEIEIKYQSYIEKEKSIIQKMLDLENLQLDQQMDYSNINSLSIEARQKLNKIKPTSIGQASRISGVSPSDLSILLSYLGR